MNYVTIFPKWYETILLSFVKCCGLPCWLFNKVAFMGKGFRNKTFAKYAKSYWFLKPVWYGTVSYVWSIWSVNSPSLLPLLPLYFSFHINFSPTWCLKDFYYIHPLWSLLKYDCCVSEVFSLLICLMIVFI